MAFRYGFYNSLHGDQEYNAEDFSKIFDGLITDGVFDSIGEAMAVVPGEGFGVIVKTGKAWFNHTWNINSTYQLLRLSAADPVRPRYDAVVLEVDAREESRKNSLKIIKGTPAVNPVYPTLTNEGDLHQYPLAYVRVNAGATDVSESNIVPMIGQSPCPFVSGILKSVDITDLFVQWNGEFHEWFNAIQADLEGNVVTNLLHRIELVDEKTNANLVFQSEYPNTYLWAIGTDRLGIIHDNEPKINAVFFRPTGSGSELDITSYTFQLADNIILNVDGSLTRVNPKTVTINKTGGSAQCDALKGKWILWTTSYIEPTDKTMLNNDKFVYIPEGAAVTNDPNAAGNRWEIRASEFYYGRYGYEEEIESYSASKTNAPPQVASGKRAIAKGRLGTNAMKMGFGYGPNGGPFVISGLEFEPRVVVFFDTSLHKIKLAVKGNPVWENFSYDSAYTNDGWVEFGKDYVKLAKIGGTSPIYYFVLG